MWINLGISKMD